MERLYELLKLEKNKNVILKEQIMSESENVNKNDEEQDFKNKLLQQTFEDGEKMHEMSKKLAEQDRNLAQLKADNCKLKMRINEINSQNVNKIENKKKTTKMVIENVVFETKTKPQIKLEQVENEVKTEPSEPLKENKAENLKIPTEKSRKTVSFSDDTAAEPEVKKKIPRVHVERKIIDAQEEAEKMNEQCKQQ